MSRPNFLFIIADDHRHSAIGALNIEAAQTPTLDQLLADGTDFTQAHIMGSTSGAVCMPSRGMLMTGQHLFDTSDPLPDAAPLLPELLWDSGYTTFATGKWHNRRGSFARCFAGGGKIFFGGMSDQYAVPVQDFDPGGAYSAEDSFIADGFSTTVFADEMIGFLDSHKNTAQPFFAYISLTSPHDPRTPPAPFDKMYDPADIALPANFAPEHPFDIGVRDIRDEVLAGYPRGEEEIRQHIADYYGMISHQDMEIGRVLAALSAKGLSENTIVVYTADHGLSVGQHGLMGKQNLYDHSMRIPLILRGPGIAAGARCEARLYLHDLYPTLLEQAGVPVPDSCAAQSIKPLLDDSQTSHREVIFSAYQGVFGHPGGAPYQRSIKDQRHKLILTWVAGVETWQLFDLATDPWETNDLIASADHAETVADLKGKLRSQQRLVNDPVAGQDRAG
ncbi:MAG: sulfatase-like hydrolase/transferase [Chloroflexi bacterium]|nr:sulfatase-like hydrolase/transferase [Chloroflexota bacterium]MYI40945.1 sulfatase-like hydrolase/transferase [Chloroflexota bacterium]